MNKDAAEVLKQIADKLDIPVQTLWSGLVAYAPFTFWQWVAGIAFGLVLSVTLFALLSWAVKNNKNHQNDEGIVPLGIVGIAIFFFTVFFALQYLPEALAAKYAPEAWAAKQIIGKFR